ncbi:MAG TPA: ABC transporter permease [Gemmatimonadaceae bacterium]|nr:ABC transporter permease [Gemmatimonadaceae bacterium]
MPILEAISLALQQIRVQKLKSAFTVLGITLGVMFLIAVVSIVEGVSRYMEHDVIGKLMTVNGFEVRRRPSIAVGDVDEATLAAYHRRPPLYEHDTVPIFDALPQGFRHAVENSGILSIVSYYTKPRPVLVWSVTADYFAIRNLAITAGRPFSEQENALHVPVAVIGQDVQEHFFPRVDPLGRELRIGSLPYRVIGIAEKQGSILGTSLDRFVITPYGAPAGRLTSPALGQIDGILIQGSSPTAQIAGEEAVRQVLRALHGLHPTQPDDFTIETPEAALAYWQKIRRSLIIAGIIFPAIGLIVGAIVIMNIMLVAVAERTREIGIRKSVGATRRDILLQFLIESAALSTLGAMVGIGAGIIMVGLVAEMTPLPTTVALWSVLTSIGLGIGVGIVASVYPASRAAQLDPIMALHTE